MTTSGYSLWQHETGTDKIVGASQLAVRAYHQTPWVTVANLGDPTSEKGTSLSCVEPDIVQTGAMSVKILQRANAKATKYESDPVTIAETPALATDQIASFKNTARQVSFVFQSNTSGGDYWMGKTQIHIEPADGRITQ
jgi:hypothetical protein